MARRNSWIRSTFGTKWNIWDFMLLFVIIAYPIYIISTEGIKFLLEDLAGLVYAVVVASFIVKRVVNKASR
jgi:hypothetical protein